MTDGLPPQRSKRGIDVEPSLDESDLEERLVRLRARFEREGRKLALQKIDKAIEEARRARPSNP